MPRAVEVDGGFIFIPTEDEEAEIERRKQELREEEQRQDALTKAVEDIAMLKQAILELRNEVVKELASIKEDKNENS